MCACLCLVDFCFKYVFSLFRLCFSFVCVCIVVTAVGSDDHGAGEECGDEEAEGDGLVVGLHLKSCWGWGGALLVLEARGLEA